MTPVRNSDGAARLVAGITLALLVGCSTNAIPVGPPTTAAEASFAVEDPELPSGTGSEGTGEGTGLATTDLCEGLEAESAGTVANPELTEASGIVASEQQQGLFWAHNDSGNQPMVYAIGSRGEDLGSFPVPGVSGVDIEDIALVGGSIYLADIGDNNEQRSSVFVYRFDEPAPGSDTSIGPVTTFELRYPDRAHDAESFLVDPVSGDLIIIDKTFRIGGEEGELLSPAPARIFTAPDPGNADAPITLRHVGFVALDELAERATAPGPTDEPFVRLGLGGVATGASIRADGGAIAVRTYATVWLFTRAPGQSIADALSGAPCEAPTLVEQQGESIGFLPGSDAAFVTISEGTHPSLNLTEPRSR